MAESNTFAHASRNPGRMHACGHDGHTAMLLAAAQHLAKHRDFDGIVYLLFQPAEEGGGGAREMIKDGLFTEFPMDAVFGMHNWPGIAVGQLAVCPGPCMASSNEFFITIRGRGSHAALPHLAIDPVPIACQMVQAFQTIITRNKKPTDTGVISVTTIHTGEATNVVPDSVRHRGHRAHLHAAGARPDRAAHAEIAQHTAAAFGATVEFRFHRNYPPTVNHDAEAEFVADVMRDTVGAENTLAFEPSMTAEDFSYFLLEKPGAYFVIGNGDGRHRLAYSRSADDGDGAADTHNLGPVHAAQPALRLQRRPDPAGRHAVDPARREVVRAAPAEPRRHGPAASRFRESTMSTQPEPFAHTYAEARAKFLAAAVGTRAGVASRAAARRSSSRRWRWTSPASAPTTPTRC